jgi:class 3 adenylate cyclase
VTVCPSCSAENADDAQFCSSCGRALASGQETCVSCGAELPADALFCPRCGTPVERTGESERKLVTALFADVTGSTSLGEQLDPEDLKDVLGAYSEAMRSEIEGEGGTVENSSAMR